MNKNDKLIDAACNIIGLIIGCVIQIALMLLCWNKVLVPLIACAGITLPTLVWWQMLALLFLLQCFFGHSSNKKN